MYICEQKRHRDVHCFVYTLFRLRGNQQKIKNQVSIETQRQSLAEIGPT